MKLRMKNSILLTFLLLAFTGSYSQLVTSFSTDKDKFLKELDQFMTASKIPQNQRTMDDLQKLVKEGKISDAWIAEMMTTSNVMAGRLMAPATHFYNYLNAVIHAANTGKTDAQFLQWSKVMNEVAQNQKKGYNNDFLKMATFSNSFFEDGALMSSNTKTWMVESPDYQLVYEDAKPKVKFPVTTLKGFARGDTISIKQTEGSYLPLEEKWEGKSGKVDWSRAALDPSKVYCTFGPYSINVNNYLYTIDTVSFHYPDYFKQPVLGKLMDKMVSGGDSSGLDYPRFESYNADMEIKDIAGAVSDFTVIG